MNDDLHPHDDLVAAVLDGEASAEEVARVTADPELAARLDHFRADAASVAEPVAPLDPDVLDSLLDRALEELGVDDEGAVEAPVVPLRSRPGGLPRWAVGAAAAVIALLAIPVVLDRVGQNDEMAKFESVGNAISSADDPSRSSSDESLRATESSSDDADSAANGATSTAEAGPPLSTTTAPGAQYDASSAFVIAVPSFGDVGGWPSTKELDQAVRDVPALVDLALLRATDDGPEASAPPMNRELAASCGIGSAPDLAWGTGTLAGRPVLIVLRGTDDVVDAIVVLDAGSCTQVSSAPFVG